MERWLLKPVVFLLCLLPSLLLALGLIRSDLGFNPVELLTHETGQWGLRFLLITLSITPIRMITRMAWLTRFRRMLGLFAFYYALLHFSVYFLWDQSLNIGYVIEDVLRRPYITLGFFALCLLIPLAVTSTNRIRRSLGRNWSRLHRLIYLITGLVVMHFIWLTKADYLEPGIYAAIFAVLMVIRFKIWDRLPTRKTT